MSQEQVTQLYTGSHWKVEASVLSEIEHFSRFAVWPLIHTLMVLLVMTTHFALLTWIYLLLGYFNCMKVY